MAARIPTELPKEISDRYKLVSNSLRQIAKNNPKDLIVTEIGDVKDPDTFQPQAKISRWGTNEENNEVNFSLRYVDNEPGEPVIEYEGKVVKYKKPKVEFHAYDLDPSELGEDGGLEVELQLNELPDTNKFDFTIQTKGLNFFFQPPLTQEEIDEGVERPENVEGSYAVYHKTKGGMNRADGMEYKVGKAFHIYRPKVTDANGVETWGELNIDEDMGVLSVTVDQTFLDNAVYPVVVDPTFGYTSLGGTKSITNTDTAIARFSGEIANISGTLDSISVAIAIENGGSSQNRDWHFYVNDVDSDGADSHGQVAKHTQTLSLTTTGQFFTMSAASEMLDGGGYIVNAHPSEFSLNLTNQEVRMTDTATHNRYAETFTSEVTIQEDPWTDNIESSTIKNSIYATYTAAGYPELDDSSSGQVDSSSTLTVAHTVASQTNRILVVTVHAEDNADGSHLPVTGVTWNSSENFTKIAHREDETGENTRTEMWYLVAPTVTTANVVVSFTDVIEGAAASVVSIYNAKQTGQPNANNTNQADAATAPSVTVTSSEEKQMVIGGITGGSSSTAISVAGLTTQLENITNAGNLVAVSGYRKEFSGAITLNWSMASNDYTAVAAAFTGEVSAGGGSSPLSGPFLTTNTSFWGS